MGPKIPEGSRDQAMLFCGADLWSVMNKIWTVQLCALKNNRVRNKLKSGHVFLTTAQWRSFMIRMLVHAEFSLFTTFEIILNS